MTAPPTCRAAALAVGQIHARTDEHRAVDQAWLDVLESIDARGSQAELEQFQVDFDSALNWGAR